MHRVCILANRESSSTNSNYVCGVLAGIYLEYA